MCNLQALLMFLRNTWDIVVGTVTTTRLIFQRDSGRITMRKEMMTPLGAHLCAASPGSIAYPSGQHGEYVVEEWIDG